MPLKDSISKRESRRERDDQFSCLLCISFSAELMSRRLVQGLAETDLRMETRDQEDMSACSIHSPAEWGGGDAASNSAAKWTYQHSFSIDMVYYRQSWQRYLAKNCADNVTALITRRSYVE
jgi:hypothetical protein